MEIIRFGIIGLGLMGREFTSSIARWCHLLAFDVQPEIVAICDRNPDMFSWFQRSCSGIEQETTNYQELLQNDQVEAVFIAVPHHLHKEIYCAAIRAGKHIMGEKPFGIDLDANRSILKTASEHPQVFIRCTSQFPFFPAVQKLCSYIEGDQLGRILEVNAGFLHSSDLDPEKPINWKRMIRYNGEYGCMGDLGMHVCHIPFRAGWRVANLRAVLSDIVTHRPDAEGNLVPCETWDNATLFCETNDKNGTLFPMTLKMHRIAPGHKNTWYLDVWGTKTSLRFSTKYPKTLQILHYRGGEQNWQNMDTGFETAYKTITGSIFEFGFTDAWLQMWAAFVNELQHGSPERMFTTCVTPEETNLSHHLFTAALESHRHQKTVNISYA